MKKFWIAAMVGSVLLGSCGWPEPLPKLEQSPRSAPGLMIEGQNAGGLQRDEVEAVVIKLAAARYVAAANAGFDAVTGEVAPETPGVAVDVAATMNNVLAAAPGSELTAVYCQTKPDITTARLKQARRLGGYTSPILDASPGRVENILLTARLLNNSLLPPGDEFSFNRRAGEPTAERGFRKAGVFVDGNKVQELGGGMCQVSSTLYNAVLEAGLSVVERHAHSLPVSYVPPGRDATTYTDKDFRFINNTREWVMLRAFVAQAGLTVDLWALPR